MIPCYRVSECKEFVFAGLNKKKYKKIEAHSTWKQLLCCAIDASR